MKICLVVPGGVDRSGEYRVIPALLALLKRLARNHDVHVFALLQEREAATWSLAGARIHNIGANCTLWRALRSIVREHRIAPFHVMHSIWAGNCGFIAVLAARLLRVPSLLHVAGGELVSLPEIGYGGRLRWYGRVREAFALHNATAITAASEAIIESIVASGVASRHVPLGVDLAAWPPRRPQRRDIAQPARLIHVASLNRVKDQPTLLHALAMLATSGVDFHIDMVGEDTLGGEIQRMAARLGLSRRSTFHGFLTQRQLRPLMAAAHVNVISSRHEAGPLVVLEAAIAGVPTAGTAVGHIAEWSPAAASAAPVGQPRELAEAIERLLANEDLRLQIAREASRRAMTHDADYTAARFQEIYAELVNRR